MRQRLIDWYISKDALPFWLVFATDCTIIYLSGIMAYALNHGLAFTVGQLGLLAPTMLAYMICFIIGICIFHTYSGIIRHTTVIDLARTCASLFVGVFLIMIGRIFCHADSFFLAIRFRDLVLLTLIAAGLMCGLRMIAKVIYDIYLKHASNGGAYGYNSDTLINLEMEDLLPREPIEVDKDEIRSHICGKRILVTGAAGSIGSELVKLLAESAPAQLILIDSAESPLHKVRVDMDYNYPDLDCVTLVANICHSHRMENIFASYRPELVFHAAAYKHVPMMEDNPYESVVNNIHGTKVIADLAVKYGTKKFVMVSTDKAVNPTNVMGCSKRICEIYVQSLDKAIKEGKVNGHTQFVTTRFGNVLGSNGSVIPIFQEQIRKGGPVTVTHPDIIRFFMLIPEACKLVIEAGTMGKGGEIYVFDMGKPVKIADLAMRMIKLSGAKGVQIKFTGLRDGEKLYEEVLNDKEITVPTFHPKIKVAKVREYEFDKVSAEINELIQSAPESDNMTIVAGMKRIVPEFKSQHSVYEKLDK